MCVDLIVRGKVRPHFNQVEQLVDDYVIELGGSANIYAVQFAGLGGHAGVVGAVGDDHFGRLACDALRAAGVDVSRVRKSSEVKTGLGLTLAEKNDRAILTYLGSIDVISPKELGEELLAASKHWHLASYFLLKKLRSSWPAWLKRLRKAGVTTSLDPNWDPENLWRGVDDLLPHIDLLFCNQTEARALTKETDLIRAGKALNKLGPLAVIKRGKEGAIAFKNGEVWEAASQSGGKLKVVDSIGAGDCFDAAFVRAWQLGWDMPRCMKLAIRCACASLGAAGGIQGQLKQNLN